MNKNQLETEETPVDIDNNNDTGTEKLSHSSNFQDLYDDLLNTLNTNTTANDKSKDNIADKNNKNAAKKNEKSGKTESATSPRNTDFNELLSMLNTQPKKTESSNVSNANANIKSKEEVSISEDSPLKDTILNSEIFDSVVKDLNKQKEERVEKKKVKDIKTKNADTGNMRFNSSADLSESLHDETKTEKKNIPPVKENITKKTDSAQFSKITEEQDDVKIYNPSSKNIRNKNKIDEFELDPDKKAEYEHITDDAVLTITPKEEIELEIDEQDDELLKAFGIGYEAENDAVSSNTTKSKKAQSQSRPTKSKPKLKSIHQVVNGEYVSAEQNTSVYAGYKKIYTAELLKFIISSALFLILLYMELTPFLSLPLPSFLNPNYYNAIYIMIDLQILLIVAYLNADSLFFGIKSILASVVNIYYISVCFVTVTFIHTIATYLWRFNAPLWVENSQNPNIILFNSITIFGLILMSFYNLLDINIEIMGFKVISSKKSKYAVRLNNKSVLEMEEFRDIIPADTVVGNITRTKFVSNFFSRTIKKKIHSTYEKYFLAISFSVSILLFAVLLGFKIDKYVALSSAVTVILCSIPFCSVIVNIFPLYQAQKKAYDMSSAIIGAESVNDHSDVSIISVYDRDIFPPSEIKIANFKIYGINNRIETVFQHLCDVFEKLNMVVADSFKNTNTYDNNLNRNVDILSIADNGVCFVSNGRKLFMGNSEYISNIGLAVTHDHNFDEQFLKSSGSILFLSSDRELVAKLYIKYEIVPDFFDIIKSLGRANICLGIRTFDPNIDNVLLQKFVRMKGFPVKVIKLKDQGEVYQTSEYMDSGVVSKASLKSLIKTLLLCSKTKSVRKSNILIQVIAFIVGIGITSIIAILGIINGDIWAINPGYILLFHIFWMLPILVVSGLTPN